MTGVLENWAPVAEKYHPLTCGSIDGTDDYPHDKAVLRALYSFYTPNKQVEGDPLCTIFVGRLNPDTIEETLHEVFSEFGNIKRLRLVRDIISGFSKRYAFIEYKSGSAARKAAARGNKMRLDDREILVDMECERELIGWIPRRFGGGFGGKKESGQLRFGSKDRPFRRPILLNRITQQSRGSTNHDKHIKTEAYSSSNDSSRDSQRRERSYKDKHSNRYSTDSRSTTSHRTNRNSSDSHSRRHYSDDRRDRSRSPERRTKSKKHKRYSRSRSREKEHKRSRHE